MKPMIDEKTAAYNVMRFWLVPGYDYRSAATLNHRRGSLHPYKVSQAKRNHRSFVLVRCSSSAITSFSHLRIALIFALVASSFR